MTNEPMREAHSAKKDAGAGPAVFDRGRHLWTRRADGLWQLQSTGSAYSIEYIEANYGPLTTPGGSDA